MGKKVKKLISDCKSLRDSSFRLFEESRISTKDSSKARTSLDRNMKLISEVTGYIYETVITGSLELISLLREKWADEDDTLSEEDSNVVTETFKDINEFLEICSNEFRNLKVLIKYINDRLATCKPEELNDGFIDRNMVSSLSTIMVHIIEPISSISRTRWYIMAMGEEKYGVAQK